MTARPGAACAGALLLGLAVPGFALAACLELASHPDGATLSRVGLPASSPQFTIHYIHSVTRTAVEERYRVEAGDIVEWSIAFSQHGPGLPTVADAGGSMTIVDGRHVALMERRFDRVVMRVHADQVPELRTADRNIPLAGWGNRALVMRAVAGTCAPD